MKHNLNTKNFITDNEEYYQYLNKNKIDTDNINEKNIEIYQQFLQQINNISEVDFLNTCAKLQLEYETNQFWFFNSQKCFETLIEQIKQDKIKIKDYKYYLYDKKIIDGFSKYIKEYVLTSTEGLNLKKRVKANENKMQQIETIISTMLEELTNSKNKE